MEGPDSTNESRLEQQVEALRSRVLRIESALQQRGVVLQQEDAAVSPDSATPSAHYPSAPQPGPRQPPSPAPAPIYAAPPMYAAPPTPAVQGGFNPRSPDLQVQQHSLESRIATHWFNRIGILAVFIGSAWFLKFAIDNNWIGPAVRILIGLSVGIGIIAWSERFQRKGYPAFGYSLKAVGSGILYLSLWAAFAIFHLVAAGPAFAGMVAVTAFNGLYAWRHDAELLALYAIVGGMSTPLLLSTGENHEAALFLYLFTLDVAVLLLVVARPWSRLLTAAFIGTTLFVAAWWSQYYSISEAAETAFFVTTFFLLFALAPRFARRLNPSHLVAWDKLAFAGMPLLNAALAFTALNAIYATAEDSSIGALLALGFAVFYLAMLWPLHATPQDLASQDATDDLLSSIHLVLAVVFLSIALPLETRGRWLTIGWLVEGAALLYVAGRRKQLLLSSLAMLCLLLGLFLLLVPTDVEVTTPLLNRRFATYAVGIAVFAFVTWIAHNASNAKRLDTANYADKTMPWQRIAAASSIAVNGIVLIAVSWEIHDYWRHYRPAFLASMRREDSIYAQFSYSAFFMSFGAVLLAVGFWRRSAFLRWQALALLSAAIVKVFVVDVSQLSQGYRILSFLVLGALLLAISFVYQKDWLSLRTPQE